MSQAQASALPRFTLKCMQVSIDLKIYPVVGMNIQEVMIGGAPDWIAPKQRVEFSLLSLGAGGGGGGGARAVGLLARHQKRCARAQNPLPPADQPVARNPHQIADRGKHGLIAGSFR